LKLLKFLSTTVRQEDWEQKFKQLEIMLHKKTKELKLCEKQKQAFEELLSSKNIGKILSSDRRLDHLELDFDNIVSTTSSPFFTIMNETLRCKEKKIDRFY